MSSLQVLVATVAQNGSLPQDLPQKMNICSDAVICVQDDHTGVDGFSWRGGRISVHTFAERGVGRNRNRALELAEADICLIADDDMRYFDGYPELVLGEFRKHPRADVILFNVNRADGTPYRVKRAHSVGYLNYMRFGAVRIAFRIESVRSRGISFSLEFGGGARYSHGEDTLFLRDCLRSGLEVICVPTVIASLEGGRASTWFEGFTERYFNDQGALYAAISRKFYSFLCLQDAVRHRKKYVSHGSVIKNYGEMKRGGARYLLRDTEKECEKAEP